MDNLRIVLLICVVALAGCAADQVVTEQSPTPQPSTSNVLGVPSGAFKYVAYDKNNAVVTVGWLRFNPDQHYFRGKWLLYTNGDDILGPQNGSGELEGESEKRLSSHKIWINLNPDYADNNVFITGNLIQDSFNGDWGFSTIAGGVNGGTFIATKQP